MNLFDKLAVSLLVCLGMMLSQIEAAMPGSFSMVAIADDRHEAYEVTQDDSFQGYAEFFLLLQIFSCFLGQVLHRNIFLVGKQVDG